MANSGCGPRAQEVYSRAFILKLILSKLLFSKTLVPHDIRIYKPEAVHKTGPQDSQDSTRENAVLNYVNGKRDAVPGDGLGNPGGMHDNGFGAGEK